MKLFSPCSLFRSLIACGTHRELCNNGQESQRLGESEASQRAHCYYETFTVNLGLRAMEAE
jgi:hypothetical protein